MQFFKRSPHKLAVFSIHNLVRFETPNTRLLRKDLVTHVDHASRFICVFLRNFSVFRVLLAGFYAFLVVLV